MRPVKRPSFCCALAGMTARAFERVWNGYPLFCRCIPCVTTITRYYPLCHRHRLHCPVFLRNVTIARLLRDGVSCLAVDIRPISSRPLCSRSRHISQCSRRLDRQTARARSSLRHGQTDGNDPCGPIVRDARKRSTGRRSLAANVLSDPHLEVDDSKLFFPNRSERGTTSKKRGHFSLNSFL